MAWVCGNCTTVKVHFSTLEELKQHLTDSHNQAAVHYCVQDDCNKPFLMKTSLFRHLRAFHSQSASSSSSVQHGVPSNSSRSETSVGLANLESIQDDVPGVAVEENNEELIDLSLALSEESHSDSAPIDLPRVAAEVVMELRSKASLTGKAVERFQDGCTKLLQNFKSSLLDKLKNNLQLHGISEENSATLFDGLPEVINIFSGLRTIPDQLDAFAKEFGMVKPVEKFLGTRFDQRLDPQTNTYVQTQVNMSFQYVSIIDTMKSVLSNRKWNSFINEDYTSKDGILRSYMDGDHYRNHPFVSKHKNVIFIILFYDELEVSNALGSKTIIHKLGAFFCQILNAPASVSSKLSSIHLLMLAHADDLKIPGAFEKVLTPLIMELKRLGSDEGVELVINGTLTIVRALLTAVTADTLAAHELLGFLSPSANYFCRCCMIHRRDFRQDGNLVATLRQKATHDIHVQEVKRDHRFSSTCGVKTDCALNQVPYFHCAESSVFDAFHDLLEGVDPLVIKLVLRHFIYVAKVMSLAEFNISVASFSYGIPDAKNKPSPNFTSEMLLTRKKLKQTGSQMWCLMRALPFLIVDKENKILEGDRYLEIVFTLQDLMKIVFSFEISPEDLEKLEVLIFRHNDLFKSLFVDDTVELERDVPVEDPLAEVEVEDPDDPDAMTAEETGEEEGQEEEGGQAQQRGRLKKLTIRMINKLHHLTHYVAMMRKYGPLIRMWCAKFEGRLKIFRQHSAAVCNFKNIPKTMAEMFQLSNVLVDDDEQVDLEFQKGIECSVENLGIFRPLFHAVNIDDSEIVCDTNSATFCGEEYRPGLFVRTSTLIRYNPLYAIISRVYVYDHNVFLLVKPWKVMCLSARYNCHRVCPDDASLYSIVSVKNLANFRAIAPWSPSGCNNIYLSLRTDSV